MNRSVCRGRFPFVAWTLTAVLGPAGCGGGAPPVSDSRAEVTVHGTVRYKGAPVTGGEIKFDPANVRRRDAPMATAPIAKDGTYTVKTLRGENAVRFHLPALFKKAAGLGTVSFTYDAPGGDSTYDIELPAMEALTGGAGARPGVTTGRRR